EGVIPPLDPEDAVRVARQQLELLEAPVTGTPAERRLEVGDPVETILDVAHALPADLIVMGTHGRTGLRRLLMGSVAEQIVRPTPAAFPTARQVRRRPGRLPLAAALRRRLARQDRRRLEQAPPRDPEILARRHGAVARAAGEAEDRIRRQGARRRRHPPSRPP